VTLAHFAITVGASPRWVLNALARLKVPRRYSEKLARRLALARALAVELGMPLARAWQRAGRAVAADPFSTWEETSDDGAVTIRIDLPRFYSSYQARLARARTQYGMKVRGRRPTRRPKGSAVERARAYGWDVTLLDASLEQTEEDRLRRLSTTVRSLDKLRRHPAATRPGPDRYPTG
jgi:hypothetical protein